MKTPFVECERRVDTLTAELSASQKEVESRLHLCALYWELFLGVGNWELNLGMHLMS